MSSRKLPEWPPATSTGAETALAALAADWALSHGLVWRSAEPGAVGTAVHAPFALYPSPFPRGLFDQALALQTAYNELYARITLDDAFLERVIGGAVVQVDDFQKGLYEIWQTVRREGIVQVRATRALSLIDSRCTSACFAPTTCCTMVTAHSRSARSNSTRSPRRSPR